MSGLIARLLAKSFFPLPSFLEAERLRVELARILLGAILVWRCFHIACDSLFYFPPSPWLGHAVPAEALVGCLQTVLAAALTAGFLTPLAALALFATHMDYSNWTGTGNLGPQLIVPFTGALFVLRAGEAFSVDAWLARRGVRPFAALYRLVPSPSLADYRAVFWILFVCYAMLHFEAVFYHLLDSYWTGGKTVGVLCANSYLSVYYPFFRHWESRLPSLFLAFSATAVVLQTAFQLGMIPFAWSRWGMRFVIGYGFLFAAGSLLGLQISILPHVELVLWLMLFLPGSWFERAARHPVLRTASPLPKAPVGPSVCIGAFTVFYSVLIAVFFVVASCLHLFPRHPAPARVTYWLLNFGFLAPDVFNKTDLSMGDRWPVIYRVTPQGRVLLPLDGMEGERLAYHHSDLLYYGNSLRWRRLAIGADLAAFNSPGEWGFRLMEKMGRYDFERHKLIQPQVYAVDVFQNQSSNVHVPLAERYAPRLILGYTFTIAPRDGTAAQP